MKKTFITLSIFTLLLAGCATTTIQETTNEDVQTDEITTTDKNTTEDKEISIKPALEELHNKAQAVLNAGPESEITEEEFETLVSDLTTELETTLQSHSYEGNEFLDGALTDLLNVSPERHEGMAAQSYEEYFELVSPITLSLVEWQGMENEM
jgi:PBP1b-binding outer membrane lipoprotein LpoB